MKYVLQSIITDQIFSLDVTQDFTESHKASVTSHPVEYGSPISDHIYLENPSLSLKGIITDYDCGANTMIDLSSFESSMFQDVVSLFTSVSDILTGSDSLIGDPEPITYRSIEFAKALKVCMYDAHIFSLIIKDDETDEILDHYNTVAIEDLGFSRSASSSGMVEVDLKLKQVRTAKIRRSEITKAEKSALDKSVDQQAKANATKNAKSGETGTTKTADGIANANSAFAGGAESGSHGGGSDWAGKATNYTTGLGSSLNVARKDLAKQADEAKERALGSR